MYNIKTWEEQIEYLGTLINDLPEEKQAEVEKIAGLYVKISRLQKREEFTNKELLEAILPILSLYCIEKVQEYVLRNTNPGRLLGDLLFGGKEKQGETLYSN